MPNYRLRQRIAQMEAFVGQTAPFEQRVRKLAARLQENPELWLAALKGYEHLLSECLLTADGMLTWSAFQMIIELRYGPGTTLSTLPESWNSHRGVAPPSGAAAAHGGRHE